MNNNSDNIIKLNVGGESFYISKQTADKSEFLHTQVQTADDAFFTENDEIFIDRDKGSFPHILHWLHKKEIYLQEEGALKNLKDEAMFHKIDDLRNAVEDKLTLANNKVSYLLLWPHEFEALSRIDASNVEENGVSGIEDSKYHYICAINYTEQVWKCPRNIHVHTAPNKCGRQCNRKELCDHTGWVYETRAKYLVAKYA